MEFVSKENTKAKVVRALGLDEPSALDTLNRAQFTSDDAYLDAATRRTLERRNPEYAEIRKRLKRELEERQEKEVREAQNAEYRNIRSAVKLDELDIKNIDAQAAELAHRDLASGSISASGYGKAIKQYAEQLTEKRKDERARNQMMNDFFRRNR